MTTANPYQTPDANLSAAGNDYSNLSVFSPKGRLGRIRYMAYSFGVAMAFYAVMLVIMLLTGGGAALMGGDMAAAAGGAGMLMLIPAYIGLLVLMFFLTIKRCHDIGWSGWASLLIFIPLVSLLFWFVPGTKGSNEYGAQTPANGVGVMIAGLAMPVLTIVGILAAIAIPAYMGYAQRAAQAPMESSAPSFEEAMPADAIPADAAPAEEPASEEAPAEEQPQQ